MSFSYKDLDLTLLKDTYFRDPARELCIKKGEILLREGEDNDKIFMVTKGVLSGFGKTSDGGRYELFKAFPNMFVGIYSFFFKGRDSSATVIAEENCNLIYLNWDSLENLESEHMKFVSLFMPVVLDELLDRQDRIRKVAQEKERALKKLITTEKMASLGQMAAGVAHELNNAISVTKTGSKWIGDQLLSRLQVESPNALTGFTVGLEKGRDLSSKEIRERRMYLNEKVELPAEDIRLLAQSGLSLERLILEKGDLRKKTQEAAFFWELGATLFDMRAASEQASHVVKSVKALGRPDTAKKELVDINETIQVALALLRSSLKSINLCIDLGAIQKFFLNRGDLVQVWVNIIKNASESLLLSETVDPEISIQTYMDNASAIVDVRDNGPGISEDMKSKIFQPDVTTKVDGLAFGLGLGLSIVKRLLEGNGGRVEVESSSGSTLFKIFFKKGEKEDV